MKKAVKTLLLMLVLAMAAVTFAACGQSKTSEQTPSSEPTATQPVNTQNESSTKDTNSNNVIKISAIGLQDPVTMVKNFAPLCEYLSKETGKKVQFVPSASYEKAVEALKNGTVDMVHFGPVTYVQAHDGFGAEPLVKALEKGKASYSSITFVRSDSPLKDAKELKDKKFAFGDKDSMSSNCGPKYLLHKNGIKVADLAEAKNFTSQDQVVSQVLGKTFDVGAVKDGVFEKNKEKGLREIGRLTDIPTFAMTVRPGLDTKVKEDLKNALLKLTDVEILKHVDKNYTGFMNVSDSDYQSVREEMKALGIK
jgi:phosphonate transport system substrate-binding protein